MKIIVRHIILVLFVSGNLIVAQQPVLKVSPSEINLNTSSIGEMLIQVENINALRAYSIHLSYDSQKLRCISINRLTFFSNWQTFFYPFIDSNSNKLKIDEAILGQGYEDGSGDLIKIQFQALTEGDISINFLATDFRDTADNQIPIQSYNGLIHIIGPTSIKDENQNSLVVELQAHPNPFNSTTNIEYIAKYAAGTDIFVYSITGEEVMSYKVDANSERNISFIWNGKNKYGSSLPSGIYFLMVKNAGDIRIIKLVLLK